MRRVICSLLDCKNFPIANTKRSRTSIRFVSRHWFKTRHSCIQSIKWFKWPGTFFLKIIPYVGIGSTLEHYFGSLKSISVSSIFSIRIISPLVTAPDTLHCRINIPIQVAKSKINSRFIFSYVSTCPLCYFYFLSECYFEPCNCYQRAICCCESLQFSRGKNYSKKSLLVKKRKNKIDSSPDGLLFFKIHFSQQILDGKIIP